MSYFNLHSIFAVIDIGTTKICVIIAQKNSDGTNDILGIGIKESQGLSKGMVVDIPQSSVVIKEAFNEATIMAGFIPPSVAIGISGNHIKSYYSQGMSSIKNGIIKEQTIDDALTASRAIALPENEHILHSVPISYIIDGITHVHNPLGMHGMRLEVTSHIITARLSALNDLVHCCELAGIKVNDIILEPVASGHVILNSDEKKMGALMIDIGGGDFGSCSL